MKKIKYFSFFLFFLLFSCGFHLKELNPNSILFSKSWFIKNAEMMDKPIREILLRQPNVSIDSIIQKDTVVIQISHLIHSKDIQTISQNGSVSEYLLSLHFDAQILINEKIIVDKIPVTVERNYHYSNNNIYGKQEEENKLWEEIKKSAAEQLIHRLEFVQELNK